jgi:type IV secretion system protein TrbL
MNDFSAVDGFLDTFIRYIDSGFGLVAGDVTSLAAILIIIDVTLAALFWAWGQNVDILQSLIKKTLYVGAFAYILGNFAMLSNVVFQSFANLGLEASAAGFGAGDLMRPGLVAAEGMAASKPIFDQIGAIAPGPVEFFANIAEVVLLFFAGLIVIVAFFVLSIQLFVLIVEFKLTTLAGFVLVPFAFWRQTTFLAERVLGNVMASGVKVLVIAVIIGIGSTLFATIRSALPANDMTIEQAFSVVLGALTLMGLAVFCPRIAAGLVSGAPQLSAGAAVGTALGVGAATAAGAMATGAAIRGGVAATEAAATASGAVVTASRMGAMRTGLTGPAAAPVNAAVGLGAAAVGGIKDLGARVASHFRARADAGGRAVFEASGGSSMAASAAAEGAASSPDWVRKFRRAQAMREGALIAAHTVQSGDGGGASEGPDLKQKE